MFVTASGSRNSYGSVFMYVGPMVSVTVGEQLRERGPGDHQRGHAHRMHGVDADVVLAELERERAGEADETVLGRGVVRGERRSLASGGAADDDDRPAVAGLDHRRHGGFQRVEGAGEVDVDDVFPLLGGELPGPPGGHHAGVGDDDVEPAELADGVVDQALHRVQIADIGLPGQHFAPGLLHQPHGLLEVFGRRRRDSPSSRNPRTRRTARDRPLGREPQRMRASLAAGGAGDERDASGQITHGA